MLFFFSYKIHSNLYDTRCSFFGRTSKESSRHKLYVLQHFMRDSDFKFCLILKVLSPLCFYWKLWNMHMNKIIIKSSHSGLLTTRQTLTAIPMLIRYSYQTHQTLSSAFFLLICFFWAFGMTKERQELHVDQRATRK